MWYAQDLAHQGCLRRIWEWMNEWMNAHRKVLNPRREVFLLPPSSSWNRWCLAYRRSKALSLRHKHIFTHSPKKKICTSWHVLLSTSLTFQTELVVAKRSVLINHGISTERGLPFFFDLCNLKFRLLYSLAVWSWGRYQQSSPSIRFHHPKVRTVTVLTPKDSCGY